MSETKGYIKIFLAGCLWGSIGLFVKELQALGISTGLTSFLRLFFAFIIMFCFVCFRYGLSAFRIEKKYIVICQATGIVVQALCNLFYSYTVTQVGMSVAVVFMDSAPIFTLFCALLLFHEPITMKVFLAIVIDILGCVFAATGGNFTNTTLTLIPIITGLLTGFTYGLSPIFGRFIAGKVNVYVMCVYCYFFATLFLFAWSRPWLEFSTISSSVLLVSCLFGLFPTAISYVLYYGGIASVSSTSKVPVIASVELIIATIIGVVIYHDVVGMWNIVGILMILGAILLMNQKDKTT